MAEAIAIRHLAFTGPKKPNTGVKFERGLNVIYGASDTGKSFVFEAIDFMLGAQGPLRDIPERAGYDRILLGVEFTDNSTVTFVRGTSGGDFLAYEGLHQAVPDGIEGKELGWKHNPKSKETLSAFLLERIQLADKLVRKNAKGEKQSVSFRTLAHMCMIDEIAIQARKSPIESGIPTSKTAEFSTFKLLLTGTDDSSVVNKAKDKAAADNKAAKLEVIDELLSINRKKLEEITEDPGDFRLQLERLDATIGREQQTLQTTEAQYRALSSRRSSINSQLQLGLERRSEIGEMLARFQLLDEHYESDLARLASVREAGSLIAMLPARPCPLCGSTEDAQHLDSDCDGNVESVVEASDAESAKIALLRTELSDTVRQLRNEVISFDKEIPKLEAALGDASREIMSFAPDVTAQRSSFSEIIEKRAEIKEVTSLIDAIEELEKRRVTLEPSGAQDSTALTVDLSTSVTDAFAQKVEAILKAWNVPDADRVHFDTSSRDLIIAGKARTARGKGLRALTHAAFTIALMEFCKDQNLPHPGFVVLDSPLVSYREPEGSEDDLKGTDVQERMYKYLAAMSDRQVIILENVTPPAEVEKMDYCVFFSKNPHQGRYGLFPSVS